MQRYVSDRPAVEPQVGFAPDGTAYFPSVYTRGAPYPENALGVDRRFYLFQSKDQGNSWEDIAGKLPAIAVAETLQGGDPITYLDRIAGRFFFGVYTGGCTLIHWTDDDGASWDFTRVCDEGPGTDKPTLFSGPAPAGITTSGYPTVLYLCYNGLISVRCKRSTNGGSVWTPTALPYPDNLGPSGHTIGFAAASPVHGTLYVPRTVAGKARVAVSHDGGDAWEQVEVGPGVDRPFSANHGQIVVDQAGNAYYVWLGEESLPRLAFSRDSGKTWSEPMRASLPGLTAANNPAISVGRPGQVAFFYVASNVPGGHQAVDEDKANAIWNGYIGTSLDVFSESPVFATALANVPSDPLKRGPCDDRCYERAWNGCVQEQSCAQPSVPEGMYDYAGIAVSPMDGRIWVSFVDLCLESCPEPVPDSEGFSSRGSVAVQVRGPRFKTPPS
ncbi:MAG TPA: sialidase family protein [Actinomycetota bacterium]|nr:sialidase family protein [Actinomycetota bacterium]